MAGIINKLKKNLYEVQDSDYVYRSIAPNKNLYHYHDGKVKFSSEAFKDRNKEPSVGIACLCNNNPEHTKKSKDSGVVSLLVKDIRNEKVEIDHSGKGCTPTKYEIDVKHSPSEKDKAHGIIIPSPKYKNDRAFKKVQKRLAYLATEQVKEHGWEIEPA